MNKQDDFDRPSPDEEEYNNQPFEEEEEYERPRRDFPSRLQYAWHSGLKSLLIELLAAAGFVVVGLLVLHFNS